MTLSSRRITGILGIYVLAAAALSGASCSGETGSSGATGAGGEVTGAGGAGSSGSTTSGTTSITVTSATGTASTTTGTTSGNGGGPPCFDSGPGEPNDEETQAYQLAPMNDDSDPGTLNGVLKGSDDADWYVYTGTDTFGPGNTVDPTAAVIEGSPSARVCAFFECLSADTDPFDCPGGTSSDTSPDGRPGCCGHDAFTVEINCANTSSDDAKVYLRVDDPSGSVCDEYVVTYHY